MLISSNTPPFFLWILRFALYAIAVTTGWSAVEAPSGVVQVDVAEDNLGGPDSWPTDVVVRERYTEDMFGLFTLPHKYVASGVRGDRAAPTLVRATAQITLPRGAHRVLLRSRGPARLLINGRVVMETPFWQPESFALGNGGELPMAMQDAYFDLGPNFRIAPPGTREAWQVVQFSGEPVSVVLETRIGEVEPTNKSGTPFRPELGETVVAYSLEAEDRWWLLTPGARRVPYTDAGWADYKAERIQRFDRINADRRAALRSADADYWAMRRDEAKRWLELTRTVAVPERDAAYPGFNAIDDFLAARIVQAKAQRKPANAGGPDYFTDVKPILEANCYSCHQGGKVKGGLRLDNLDDALLGGNADGDAIVPGDPDASAIIVRILSEDEDEVMPAKGDRLSEAEIATLHDWIKGGAHWPEFQVVHFEPTPLADDLTFLRRVTLDTVGVVPTEAEIHAYLDDLPEERRQRAIDRLLADPRWADHWMSYWQEVLAENPNLINPTLNNTGPFRWWLYESLLDNKPMDLFVTELLRMEGSDRGGGPAGFGVASGNDVPMAAKGIIVGSAFLGVEMKCARCHDAPTHAAKQEELFSLAAMMKQEPITLPASSSVVMDHLRAGGRKPLIEVTLEPGSVVEPAWPFEEYCDEETARAIAEDASNSRDLLAAMITAPQNERFAQVMVNRLWQRYFGRGLVVALGDWEKAPPSHPQLLRWLGREFVRLDYDMKAMARLMLSSHAYQRAADPALTEPEPLFVAPAERRISAEQLVDSLFAATGKPFEVERVCLDVDSVRTIDNALDLGEASRVWMLGSISNERDRPSLTLPRIQAVTEVLQVFGWRAARPDSGSGVRDVASSVLQPALMANGTMMSWLTRLSDDHGLTHLALETQSLDVMLDRVFLRLFTRHPSAAERKQFSNYLRDGYETRRHEAGVSDFKVHRPDDERARPYFVAWSNHMLSEANRLRLEEEAAARVGDPPSAQLAADWRARFEDVIWTLLNSPEWARIP